jgi:hypothetical protein
MSTEFFKKYNAQMKQLSEATGSRASLRAEKALQRLTLAVQALDQEIIKFGRVYSPNTVGLNEWIEHNHDILSEIEADIGDQLGYNDDY